MTAPKRYITAGEPSFAEVEKDYPSESQIGMATGPSNAFSGPHKLQSQIRRQNKKKKREVIRRIRRNEIWKV